MKRLFTFGCSFTNYFWPTWADILGRQFESFENWGQLGGGNQFIFNSIIECDLKNNFTKDDTVIVMWSTVAREDRYIDYQWRTPGHIYNQKFYDKNFVKKYTDMRGYFIRDLALICAIDRYFNSRDCRFIMLAMTPVEHWNQYNPDDQDNNIDDVLPFYKSTLDKILPSAFEVIFNKDWFSSSYFLDPVKLEKVKKKYNLCSGPLWPSFEKFYKKDFQGIEQEIIDEIFDLTRWNWTRLVGSTRKDLHPTPLEHLMYVNQIFPDNAIDQDTKIWIEKIEERLLVDRPFTDLWESVKIKRW